jgi:rhamnulokinase
MSTASTTFLGVDIGAESGRLIAGQWDGRRIGLEELHRFENGAVSMAGSLRWDLLHLWKEIRSGLGRVRAKTGGSVRSIGVDTWALDYVLMDAKDEWLGLPYCYRDARTEGLIEKVCAIVPREEVFAQSGLQFMEINTLYQLFAAQKQNPKLLAAAKRLLMVPDWIHWALCGSRVTEFSNATTTQFLHPTTRSWSTGLLDQLGIPSHFLPEIVNPGTDLGGLRPELASDLGLDGVRVIAPATHDTGSAVAGVPASGYGHGQWAYISSGTWSLMGVEVPEAFLSKEVCARNFTNEGGVEGTYRLLRNVMGLWLLQQLRRGFEAAGGSTDYGTLVQLAAAAPALRSLVNPDDRRFLRPTNMIRSIQEYCRESHQPVPETEGALTRCVLESLALRYRQVLHWLEDITGQRIEVIHIVGGGSRNTLLNQFTADACQRPVVAGPVEATALGNVLVQARACGEIGSLGEMREVIRESFSHEMQTYQPQIDSLAVWEGAAARYSTLWA